MPQSTPDRAFRELVESHRRELHLHCYRMLGSPADAEDVLQETLLAAWRGLPEFAGRSSLRTWLYRIATNRCLNALRDAGRRAPAEPVPPFDPPPPSARSDVTWLRPYPDSLLDDVVARETVELAFVTALQRLPPRQVAALLLCDVLDFPLAEAAAMLDTTPTAVKGALQRARASVATRPRHEPGPGTSDLARRFAEAFAADDIAGVVELLTDDAWLAMPPAPHEYHGPAAIAEFLRAACAARTTHLRLTPAAANGQPAFACHHDDTPAGVLVLTVRGDRVAGVTRFLDPGPGF